MELLAGSGANTQKRMWLPGQEAWKELVTIDINPDHKPDVVWDLNNRPLPFDDDSFDEIHAYEVLEHLGQQGDWRGYFAEWSEWWRILKPGGHLYGSSPPWSNEWAWGDPGHTRIISNACLTFLVQPEYTKQIGKTLSLSTTTSLSLATAIGHQTAQALTATAQTVASLAATFAAAARASS